MAGFGILDDPEKMNQLMQSPLVQMGIGLLANNKGQYAMQNALGGAGQGFAQSQEFSQQNVMNAMRKQQFDMQKAQYEQAQAKQKKLEDWQSSFGQPNAGSSISGGYSPIPSGTDAPNYGMVKNPDITTPNTTFDQNKWLIGGINAGAISPIDLIKLNNGEHEYAMDKGIIYDKKTGSHQKIDGGADLDTNDIKGYTFARSPQGGNFKGSFEKYLQIKPALMAQVAGGQLAVAQGRLDQGAKEQEYTLPAPVKPKAKIANLQDIADTAKASGKTTAQVTADLKKQGYRIGN